MNEKTKVSEIFKTQGSPTITYVKRNKGEYERKLSNAIDTKGLLCLLTGPSKTGKTTLYTKVASLKNLELLIVRCTMSLKASDLWKRALEQVNFDRLKQRQHLSESSKNLSGEIGGKIGWSWLADLIGKSSIGISDKESESEIKERVLSEPHRDHLLPILKKLPFLLVVEDFHYLSKEVQLEVFQQWKTFVDNEISVVVVETTHHSADIAFSNKDLIGRIDHIELSRWKFEDLKQIPRQGLKDFKLTMPNKSLEILAQEAVGLPIIMQQACLQMLYINEVEELPTKSKSRLNLRESTVYNALHQVATERYNSFSHIWDMLCRGPREKARKYNTYEFVLSTFCLDPITFQLAREEIEPRLQELPIPEDKKDKIPPSYSINSMLNAIGSFQEKIGIQLLEWSEINRRLYITEPSFLFYLRWKDKKKASMQDILNAFLEVTISFETISVDIDANNLSED